MRSLEERRLRALEYCALRAAKNLEGVLHGERSDYRDAQRFGRVLGAYQLDGERYTIDSAAFPYYALNRAMSLGSELLNVREGEVALEMGLLRHELATVPTGAERLVPLIDCLYAAATEFKAERVH